MKAAILGNGPSRVAYSAGDYDLVIGCNIPWTTVDSTVIVDCVMVNKLLKSPEILPAGTKLHLSPRAKAAIRRKAAGVFHSSSIAKSLLAMEDRSVEIKDKWKSSGHCAAMVAILLGATDLWLFGFDSVFEVTLESYTGIYVKPIMPKTHKGRVMEWRAHWKKIMGDYPAVKFNFVRGDNDYTTEIPHTIP